MIRSVMVTNHNRESLTLDLFNPYDSGIAITNIDGLGPAQANINITDMATVDGGIFSSARQDTRNIVFDFTLLMEPTVEDARLKVYKYFPIKKQVTLRFKTDYRVVETIGYVESVTPDIFNKEETCQVSIICPDPNFYASGDTTTVFSGVIPKFESPVYSAGSYLKDGWPSDEWKSGDPNVVDMFEFGDIIFDTTAVFTYYGNMDTGVLITIRASGMAENITIWNNDTRQHISVNTNKIYQITGIRYDSGDDILIDTTLGKRSVKLFHEGKYYDILGSINRDADFFQLTNGTNVFSFQAESGEENIVLSFTYRNAYGGI